MRSLTSFSLTIPWNSAKLMKILSWNHCRPRHDRRQNGIAESSAQSKKRYVVQSGLDENWWADSMECFSWVILAYMCVKLLVRLYVCHRVGPFWVHFGSILGPFWVHFGSILGPFWVHFGSILLIV